MTSRAQTYVFRWPQTLPGRIIAGVLALAGLVTAFFFLFFVLLAAGIALSVLYLRALWRNRKARATAQQDVIEGEYSVEVADIERLDDKTTETKDNR